MLAVRALERRGFAVPEAAVQEGLLVAAMPGRSEAMPRRLNDPDESTVIIDAAHNPDKIRALTASLPHLVGSEIERPKPVLLTGALAGKDAGTMLASLLRDMSAVVTTAVGVTGKEPRAASELAELVTATGFTGPVAAHTDVAMALEEALALAKARGAPLLVTGSIFLAGRVRSHWYPDSEILRQRTPWPEVSGRDA